MMKMQFTKDKTLAFTGHRFYEYRLHDKIVARLTATILEAYDNGIRCFYPALQWASISLQPRQSWQ